MTGHAADRLRERLTDSEVRAIADRLDEYAAGHPVGTVAVKAGSIGSLRGTAWSDASNGDTVVAIVRDGTVSTVMLRRSTQPWTRAAFNVQRLDIL